MMAPPDRLALFVGDLQRGGAQRSMVTLAGAFARRGVRVDVVTPRGDGELRDDLGPDVRVVELERWWTRLPLVGSKKRRRMLAAAPALAGYLRRERPTALLATSHSVNVSAALGWSLAQAPTRLVLRIDSQLSRAPELRDTRTQRRRLRRARRYFPRADAIVAISRGVADDVARVLPFPRERIQVIYNPVTTPRLLARAQEPLHHPWFAPGSPPVVLGVGRLVAQKDFATLLHAFARVRQQRDARLLVLGEGRERPALEALLRDLGLEAQASLPGAVDNPFPYMARAALLAVSSAWEGFGNVLVEALACGCPVASTDCPSGPAEILEDGSCGPLSPVGDAEALARSIVSLLDQPPDRDLLRKRAELFSEERSAERYLRVLLG